MAANDPQFSDAGQSAPPPSVKSRVLLLSFSASVKERIRLALSGALDFVLCGEGDVHSYPIGRIALALPDVVMVEASPGDAVSTATIGAIRQLTSEIRIVAITTVDRPVVRQTLLSAGATDIVALSVADETLLSAIRRSASANTAANLARVRSELAHDVAGLLLPTDGLPLDALDREIAFHLGCGTDVPVIAERLRLPLRTIETRLKTLQLKLNLATGAQLIRFCVDYSERHRK